MRAAEIRDGIISVAILMVWTIIAAASLALTIGYITEILR